MEDEADTERHNDEVNSKLSDGQSGEMKRPRILMSILPIRWEELTPCRFCGAEAELIEDMNAFAWKAGCTECGNDTDLYGDRREALTAWNENIRE
jgi:hypothetical protein